MNRSPEDQRGNRYLLPLLAALVTVLPSTGFANDTPVLRVVFFTPSDVEHPEGVHERLKEYVDYAQTFYEALGVRVRTSA